MDDAALLAAASDYVAWDPNAETRAEVKAHPRRQGRRGAVEAAGHQARVRDGGLRAPMQAGYGGLNELTVVQATQGLAAYLLEVFGPIAGQGARATASRSASTTARAARSTRSLRVPGGGGARVARLRRDPAARPRRRRVLPRRSSRTACARALRRWNHDHRLAQPEGGQRVQGVLGQRRADHPAARQGDRRRDRREPQAVAPRRRRAVRLEIVVGAAERRRRWEPDGGARRRVF